MGMFDSIKIDARCPYCGKTSEIEFQTKELDCTLEVWSKGDYVGTDKLNRLDCIADCHSEECVDYADRKTGYKSGFGRMFEADIILADGRVTGEFVVTDLIDP